MRPSLAATLIAAIALSLAASPASAATLEPIGRYASPVYVTSDPEDADRLFVVELEGRVMLTEQGETKTFADLRADVSTGVERGLLSIAFDPEYADTGLLYAYYTREPDGAIQIDELRVDSGGDAVDPAYRRSLLTIPHALFPNHNGGQLQFGPDGHLYIATGDGGLAGDPFEAAQDRDALLGKLLRIDPRPSGGRPYSIPAGNPFAGEAAGADEIWSYGLRNPFRFSFDRASGALLLADVGQDNWEEVNYEPAPGGGRGDNFGWDCREGRHPYEPAGCSSDPKAFTEPMLEYSHEGDACSITGGYVSRDPGVPGLLGRYLYSDLCLGEIRSALPALPTARDDRPEGLTVATPASFGEDACGRLYVTSLATQEVSRIVGPSPTDCSAGERSCGELIAGTPGDDRLRGSRRAELLRGGGGADRLRGRGGADCLRGGAGRDRLAGGRGADELDCGPGRDLALADRSDRVRGCERVRVG